jgi:DNA replication protein DnaC
LLATKEVMSQGEPLMRCPDCGQVARRQWIAAHCGLEPHEQGRKLHHWQQVPDLSIAQQVQRQKARTMIRDALESRAGLYTFYGDYGSGKTLALQIMVNEMRDSYIREGFYAPFIRILQLMRGCYDKTEGAAALWQRILDVPVLAIDEVTRVRDDSQWQQEDTGASSRT